MMQIATIVIADSHAGHRFGLLSPHTVLEDTDEEGNIVQTTPTLFPQQEFLWEVNSRILEEAKAIPKEIPIVLIHLGDLIHGVRHKDELVSLAPHHQLIMAQYNLEPFYAELPNLITVRIAVGTPAHELDEGGSASMLVGRHFKTAYPDIDTRVVKHGFSRIGDMLVDYAHHGPGESRRHWLKGNNARYYLRDICERHKDRGIRAPDVVLRGHIHEPVYEILNMFNGRGWRKHHLLVCSPLSMMSAYARMRTRSHDTCTVGGAILFFDGRKVYMKPVMETRDIRTKEIFA